MADQSGNDRLDNVAPGDIITLPPAQTPGTVAGQYKVVHKDSNESCVPATITVTLEGEDGVTFDVELPADSVVDRSLESKWESTQSPTPHQGS